LQYVLSHPLLYFSQIILLGDGKLIYNGPPTLLASHFSRNGFDCPKLVSIADYMMSVINTKDSDGRFPNMEHLIRCYRQTAETGAIVNEVKKSMLMKRISELHIDRDVFSKQSQSTINLFDDSETQKQPPKSQSGISPKKSKLA